MLGLPVDDVTAGFSVVVDKTSGVKFPWAISATYERTKKLSKMSVPFYLTAQQKHLVGNRRES